MTRKRRRVLSATVTGAQFNTERREVDFGGRLEWVCGREVNESVHGRWDVGERNEERERNGGAHYSL